MSNWTIAISLTFPTQAHMVQGYLESEGIETMLKDEFTTQVNNLYSNALGGVKVMVREEDLEIAQQILHKGGYLNPENVSTIESVHFDTTTNKKECPFCHSENIGKKKNISILSLIISLFISAIFPSFKKTDMCFDCGKEWKYKK